jgi:hypothetical protein
MARRIIKKLKAGTGATEVIVYGDPTKLAALCDGFTEVAAAAVTSTTVTTLPTAVRRYPGDPAPFARIGSTFTRDKGGVQNLQTLPGRPFTVEVTTGTAPNTVTDVTQFTFVGPFKKLRAHFSANATKDLVVRSPGGKPWPISA